jgi:hypothetical protein
MRFEGRRRRRMMMMMTEVCDCELFLQAERIFLSQGGNNDQSLFFRGSCEDAKLIRMIK